VRAIARLACAVLLFAVVAPIHILTRALLGRSPWPSRFLRGAAWAFGARVSVRGDPVRGHVLLIANHTSWLDILILGGSVGTAFVSKDQLGHSFIHWLADQNGTIYVKRTQVKGAKDQAMALARALERPKPVAVFPEGTTGPGTHLLPFRSTLLEAANFAAKDVDIRPVAIDYGEARAEMGWFDDEPGMSNVWRLLGRRGSLPVTVKLLPPLDRSGGRKQLTADAREAIAQTLGFKSDAQSPIAEAE
jgi:1-acyl-sn-glycerol-3-phosphate acyltransferase